MTRAQEAEENYLVKRELATVKQQSEEASAQLEQATKTIWQLQQGLQWVRRTPGVSSKWHILKERIVNGLGRKKGCTIMAKMIITYHYLYQY